MKKLPKLREKQWVNGRSFGFVGLLALLLAVSYWGSQGVRTASLNLPIARVPIEATEEPKATDAPAALPDVPLAEPSATQTPDVAASAAPTPLPPTGFAGYRGRLTATREKAASLLDEVIQSAFASADIVQEALLQKMELARTSEIEATVETLLQARGFPEALCTVRQGSVNIVVRMDALTQQQAAQILDVAMAETGEAAGDIRIVPEL